MHMYFGESFRCHRSYGQRGHERGSPFYQRGPFKVSKLVPVCIINPRLETGTAHLEGILHSKQFDMVQKFKEG